MVCDRYKLPIKIGDIIAFARDEQNTYGTDDINWSEGEVVKIDSDKWALGFNNYILEIKEYKFSIDAKETIRNNDEHKKWLPEIDDFKEEHIRLTSNQVINSSIVKHIAIDNYPELFI